MSLFDKKTEKKVVSFIRKMSDRPHYLSVPKISDKIVEKYKLVLEASSISQLRKKHNIKSGVKKRDERERELAIIAWLQKPCIYHVAEFVGISNHSAKYKILSLHAKGLVDAHQLLDNGKPIDKRKDKNRKYTRVGQKELTYLSSLRVNEMRQRKMDRVAELCDMRTI